MSNKKAVIYVRTPSFEGQSESISSATQQQHACEDFCLFNGFTVHDILFESAHGDQVRARPQLNGLIRLVERRQIDAVVVYNLTCLAQSEEVLRAIYRDTFGGGAEIFSVLSSSPLIGTLFPANLETVLHERDYEASLYQHIVAD